MDNATGATTQELDAQNNAAQQLEGQNQGNDGQNTPPAEPDGKTGENSYNDLPEWAKRRMGELAAEKNAARERLAALEAAQAQVQQQQVQQSQAPAQNQGNVEELAMVYAQQIAEQRVQQQTFINAMNDIEQKAKAEFGQEYDRSISNLNLAGVGGNDFLQAIASVPNPEAVITFLGKSENVGDAIRIANLSPLQMGIELTKLSSKAVKSFSKQVSRTPPPMSEVGGGSSGTGGTVEPDPSDHQAWIAWRNKNKRR